mgnify:CR=1 FL=1
MNNVSASLYVSVEQVAVRFGVSKDTIWRWRREGDFPAPVRLGGRTSRWRLSDIETWEAQCPCCLVTRYPMSA